MTTKTITLDLDAYEKLHAAQKPGESLSEVIRRTDFTGPSIKKLMARAPTGAQLLEYYRNGGGGFSAEELDSIEEALKHDLPPDDPWA